MANVGGLTMTIRAVSDKLGGDLDKATSKVKKFAKGTAENPYMAELVTSNEIFSRGARNVDRFGSAVKRAFGTFGATRFAGVADMIADVGMVSARLGPAGLAIAAVAVNVGLLVVGFRALQSVASNAMRAVDSAFKMGDRSKTIEALNKIISAGRGVGIKITLADAQAVQYVNQHLSKLSDSLLALGIQIVRDFQPEIIKAIDGLAEAVRLMSSLARFFANQKQGIATGAKTSAALGVIEGLPGGITGMISGAIARGIQGAFSGSFVSYSMGQGTDASLESRSRSEYENEESAAKKMKRDVAQMPAALSAYTSAQYSASLQARTAGVVDPVLAENKKQTDELKRLNENMRDLKNWFPANMEVAGI